MMKRRQLIPERPCAFLCRRQLGSCPLLHIHDEMLQELRNKNDPQEIIPLSKKWALLTSGCSFFSTTEPCETPRRWNHEALKVFALLEYRFPVSSTLQSTTLFSHRLPKTYLSLLTSAAWEELSSLLTSFQRFVKTTRKQMSPSLPLKNRRAARRWMFNQRKAGNALGNCVSFIWNRISYLGEPDAVGGKCRINGR